MVSLRKLKGILTEQDKQKFLEKLMNEHKRSKYEQVYENTIKYGIIDKCPYTGKDVFFDTAHAIRKEITIKLGGKKIKKEFLITKCAGRYVFILIKPYIIGDILTGERYRVDISIFSDVEIKQLIDNRSITDKELKKMLGIKTVFLKLR